MESYPDKYQITQENNSNIRLTNFKKGTFLFKLRCHFRSYCNHTSIHGFQYFGQNRTVAEKCWWILIFMGIISCCGFTIYLIYNKWQKSPVIVSLTTTDTPIYQVPFPAVTICPTIKFSKECINFSDILKKAFNEDIETGSNNTQQRKIFAYMLPLCNIGKLMDEDDLENLEFESIINGSTVSHEMFESFQNCSPYLSHGSNTAKFMGGDLYFRESFHPYLTEDGLCFTFNMLSTEDIFSDKVTGYSVLKCCYQNNNLFAVLELNKLIRYFHPGFNSSGPKSFYIPQHGYSIKAGLETYPRRALMSGAINSLEIRLFHRKEDIDFVCSGAEQGYKIILHHPMRIPRPSLEYSMAQFSKATTISIKPSMMTTSYVVESYAPDKRDCYFEGEKELEFFKIYSQVNCQFECLTNYTLKECGCVAFYMPREASTPICGIGKMKCVNSAKKKYNLNKLKSKLQDFHKIQVSTSFRAAPIPQQDIGSSPPVPAEPTEETNKTLRQKREIMDEPTGDLTDESARCNCYRTCNDLTYTGTSTTMEYDWKEELLLGEILNTSEFDFTLITIFLNTDTISTTERNELYGPTDFLSNFGGLLGLFTGFSILSFMEILYFCSLRIFGNRKLLGRWYGDKEE